MIFDLFFRVGPAIQAVFKLGFEPKEELFFELTPEQYDKLENEGEDVSKDWYTILPEDPKYNVPELLIIDADGKQSLIDAAKYINNKCDMEEDLQFDTFEDKLSYLATRLPDVFTAESNYAAQKRKPYLKLVK